MSSLENLCIFAIFLFFIGASFGSFFKLIVDRYETESSFILKPSYCFSCKEKLLWWHNIPLISYIVLRGKCFFCKSKISFSLFLAELFSGIIISSIFVLAWLKLYPVTDLVFLLVFFLILILLTFFDLKHKIVPHFITYSGILLFLIYSTLVKKSFLNSISSLGVAFVFMDLLYFFATLIKKFKLEINLIFILLLVWSLLFFFNQSLYFLVLPVLVYFILQKKEIPLWLYITSGFLLAFVFLVQLIKISLLDFDFDKLVVFLSGIGFIYLICEVVFYLVDLILQRLHSITYSGQDKSCPYSTQHSALSTNVAIGGGDITIFALISVYLGIKIGFLVLFIASFLAVVSHFIMRFVSMFFSRSLQPGAYVPFVPFLSAACFIIIIIKLMVS